MVLQDCLDDLLARLLMRSRKMLEGLIRWRKTGVVGLRAVEQLDQVVELVNDLGKPRCELAAGD